MDDELKNIQKLKDQLGSMADKINMLFDMNETEQLKYYDSLKINEQDTSASNFVVLILLVALVFSILVFFGYKLYKSLADKERKRDEKRKMKQMKKKK